MTQLTCLVLLGALAAHAAAQSVVGEGHVLSAFLLSPEQSLVGSIVGSDATATTLAIACPSDSDTFECDILSGATVTVGPSTFHGTFSTFDGSVSVIPDCRLFGSPTVSSAECEQTFIGPQGYITAPGTELTATTGEATVMTSSTASITFEGTDVSAFLVGVTITAGNAQETSGDEGATETSAAESSSQAGAAASATESGGADGGAKGVSGISIGLFGVFGMLLSVL